MEKSQQQRVDVSWLPPSLEAIIADDNHYFLPHYNLTCSNQYVQKSER